MNKGRILLIAGALALVALVVNAFLPKPVDVDLATISRGNLRVAVEEDGETRIKEKYVVSSPVIGRLSRIEHDPDDVVVAGKTLLAVIEPAQPTLLDERARAQADARVKGAVAAVSQANAKLDRAKAADSHARKEMARTRILYERKSSSRQQLDDALFKQQSAADDLKSAELGVTIANYELEQARAALIHTLGGDAEGPDSVHFQLKSPISGRILRVFEKSSTIVKMGTQLIELGDPADLEIQIDVLSQDAVRIKQGARVILEHWGGANPLRAHVRVVEPSAFTKTSALGVEEQRVYVIADFDDPPGKRPALGDAYRVEARIIVWEKDDVLKIPAGALFRNGDGWAVFRDSRGKARLQPVEVGQNNGLEAEILSGLGENDRVILHPSDRIRNGVGIRERSH